MTAHPNRTRRAVGTSLGAGALGTVLLAVESPPGVAALGAALVGFGAGIPFAAPLTGAAVTRPDAPAAAVGVVNGAANLIALVGTPLVGLTFSLPGDGRLGFEIMGGL